MSSPTYPAEKSNENGFALTLNKRALLLILACCIQMIYVPTSNRIAGGIEPKLPIDTFPIWPIWARSILFRSGPYGCFHIFRVTCSGYPARSGSFEEWMIAYFAPSSQPVFWHLPLEPQLLFSSQPTCHPAPWLATISLPYSCVLFTKIGGDTMPFRAVIYISRHCWPFSSAAGIHAGDCYGS